MSRIYVDKRGTTRDAKKEYEKYQSSPKQIADRSARNKARREAVKKYGKDTVKNKDVAHKSPLIKSKNPTKVGWTLQSPHKNRGSDRPRKK